jgi:hypothetical protein
MKKMLFVLIMLVLIVVGWYVAEGFYFLTILLKSMTPIGAMIDRIILHIVFLIFSIGVPIIWMDNRNGTKQK